MAFSGHRQRYDLMEEIKYNKGALHQKDKRMKIKLRPFSGSHQHLILALFVIALLLLIPNIETLADSKVPTVTNTPEATDTPIPPTQTPIPPAAVTNTPIPIIPTEFDDNTGAIAIATLPSPGNNGGLSTINTILLMILGIAIVIVIGVIVYIFINQTRGGLGSG